MWDRPGYRQPRDWKRRRARILRRDPVCTACRLRPSDEVDHVVPVHRGGGHGDDNLAGICTPCHQRKTQAEAQAARRAAAPSQSRRRPPERHPGLL